MGWRVRLSVAAALTLSLCAWAAPPPPPASPAETHADARALLAEAIGILRAAPAMGGAAVDWDAEGARLERGLGSGAAAADAHVAIAAAVALLKDPHARFVAAEAPKVERMDGAAPAQAAPVAAHPAPPTKPEGKLIDGDIAYVVVPMCGATDVDGLRRYAAALRGVIAGLAEKQPKGWVVEQRFNGGGNVWPMLVGLRPLLGDGPAATSVVNGKTTQVFGIEGDAAWLESDGVRREQLVVDGGERARALVEDSRIAALIGPWTMSSGEMLTLALRGRGRGRGRERTFGEATAGLTTVTYPFRLSDGSTLSLPVSRMGDREGRAEAGAIEPDEAVAIGDWPLAHDAVVEAAIRWIREGRAGE